MYVLLPIRTLVPNESEKLRRWRGEWNSERHLPLTWCTVGHFPSRNSNSPDWLPGWLAGWPSVPRPQPPVKMAKFGPGPVAGCSARWATIF